MIVSMNDKPASERRGTRWGQRRLPSFDYHDTSHAIFVTMRAHAETGDPFTDPRLAQEIVQAIEWLRTNRLVRVYAYCLMPDHLHLLVQLGSDQWSLGDVMGSLKSFTTKRSWALGYEGELWQARFYDHIVRRSEDGKRIAEYILQNPVRKGLAEEADQYPYAGAPDPI
jgi:putative transposase